MFQFLKQNFDLKDIVNNELIVFFIYIVFCKIGNSTIYFSKMIYLHFLDLLQFNQ